MERTIEIDRETPKSARSSDIVYVTQAEWERMTKVVRQALIGIGINRLNPNEVKRWNVKWLQ